MQKTISFLGIICILISCKWIPPIHSFDQLEPLLCKHVGSPSRIDTTLKKEFQRYNIVSYHFDNMPEVTFEHLVDFLTKAYEAKPVYDSRDRFRSAHFIPLRDGSGAYKIQLEEWISLKDGKRHLGFCVIDIDDEIIPPLQVF
ncbi:hypothetical protein B5F32_05845 [Parabacteroides distasonis]|uniref:Lipoprotein n=1 Tax=Parabacteroides distasonis TaxID=823 RepID=A0A1Y4IJF0_PARDI|nr:hypothetical protein [Parabacteroides distasonis]OUP20447.1 hypothetical protein B5F32_05845 [Parabacteroides distasonis]